MIVCQIVLAVDRNMGTRALLMYIEDVNQLNITYANINVCFALQYVCTHMLSMIYVVYTYQPLYVVYIVSKHSILTFKGQ
jgi:hypothetical protein